MIISKVENLGTYQKVNPYMKELVAFFENHDWRELSEGKLPIAGDKVFGNCFNYVADGVAGDFFETHYKYLDVHLVVENTEDMAVSTKDSTTVSKAYDEEKVIEFHQGQVEQLVHLKPGDCLITFPEDLHQPKVRVNDKVVKKAVFKLAIKDFVEEDCHGSLKT